jgi:hypothetical protein
MTESRPSGALWRKRCCRGDQRRSANGKRCNGKIVHSDGPSAKETMPVPEWDTTTNEFVVSGRLQENHTVNFSHVVSGTYLAVSLRLRLAEITSLMRSPVFDRLLQKEPQGAFQCSNLCVGVHHITSADGRERHNATEKKSVSHEGGLPMSHSKLAIIAVMLLSGFVLCPQGANAAKFCAQLRGATAVGHPDCSFSTLDACRARIKHRGGGHCYQLHA